MQGYVLVKKSQMAYDLREAHRVVTFAEAAQHSQWQFPRKVRAEVTRQQAFGLAMTGESLSKVEQKMDQARTLLTSSSPDDDPPGPDGAYFTVETLLLRQATRYTEAGKPAKAAALFADVIASGTLSRRDAGFFRARRAAALALSGEPDEAATVGLDAILVAKETSTGTNVSLVPWTTSAGAVISGSAASTSNQKTSFRIGRPCRSVGVNWMKPCCSSCRAASSSRWSSVQ